MAYQALYRKYRPQIFGDVIGQEHITETLKNEIASGKLSHAYLFTGSRGTGKTTCAKILARAVNCLSPRCGEPCGECELCLSAINDELTDIMEIDAASNNGVDSIRELRDQVSFAPAAGKYRVYIIDEVHMLSISAFNALLKTLEEPPAHVIFILATTEVHKLPTTILSRCQRFDFRRISPEKICERLQKTAADEGFSLTAEAAMLIASAADGGMRDALSILDLCASNNLEVDESVVSNVCAMAGNDYLIELAGFIHSRDTEKALLLLDKLHNMSVDMLRLLTELTEHYRNLMIVKTVRSDHKPVVCSTDRLKELQKQAEAYELSELLSILTVLQDTAGRIQNGNRRCEMEMTVIRLCNPSIGNDLGSIERRISALEAGSPIKRGGSLAVVSEENQSEKENISFPELPAEAKTDSPGDAPVENWGEVVHLLQATCPPLAGVLDGSAAYIRGQYLLIDTQNSQFLSLVRSSNPLYRERIREAAQRVLGAAYKLGPYRAIKQTEGDPLAAFAEKLKSFEINQE